MHIDQCEIEVDSKEIDARLTKDAHERSRQI
jgi:hypothetical protein